MSLDSERLRLRQLNPAQDLEIPRERIRDLHLVVGVYYSA